MRVWGFRLLMSRTSPLKTFELPVVWAGQCNITVMNWNVSSHNVQVLQKHILTHLIEILLVFIIKCIRKYVFDIAVGFSFGKPKYCNMNVPRNVLFYNPNMCCNHDAPDGGAFISKRKKWMHNVISYICTCPAFCNGLSPGDAIYFRGTSPTLCHVVVWRLFGAKPFREAMLTYYQLGPW